MLGIRSVLVLIVWVTCLGAVLRVIGLNHGLWYDEMVTLLTSVRVPFRQIVSEFPGNNNHAFYSVLAHATVTLFGEAPWSLRLPAFLAGVAGIPLLYLLGRTVTTAREALLAAGLLAVSYHHIWFSQNARGYSALASLTILATLLLVQGTARGRRSWFVAYGIVAALGIYTHLTMVFVVVAHALSFAVSWRQPRSREASRLLLLGLAVTGVCSLILYAPMLVDVQRFFLTRPNSSATEVANQRWMLWEMLRGLRIGLGSAGAVAIGGLLFWLGLVSYARQNLTLAAMFVLPGPLMALATVALGRPTFPRFYFLLIGFALLVIVRGAIELGDWAAARARSLGARVAGAGLGTVMVLLMIAASAMTLPYGYRYPKQDFEGAMRFVESLRQDDEPVVTAGLLSTYAYQRYYRKPWHEVERPEQLWELRAKGQRAWLLYTSPQYIDASSPALMAAIRRECLPARVFHGTLGGGDVIACTIEPTASAGLLH